MAGTDNLSTHDTTIMETLKALGVNTDTVDKRTLGHLRKIEEAISREAEERKKAEAEVRRHNFSVSAISKISGVSHATFYNKAILSRYVNARKENVIARTATGASESLRQRLEEAQRQLDTMNKQGAQMVQLQIENDRLRKRVRMLEVQAMGGIPAADGKGEVIPIHGKSSS